MTPGGIVAPSAHETQLPNESLVQHNPASSALVETMTNPSIENDTLDAREDMGADENVGASNYNLDGNPNGEDMNADDMDSGENDADENDSDSNSSDETDGPLDYATMCEALSQFRDIMAENGIMADKIEELETDVGVYKCEAAFYKREAKRMQHNQKTMEDEIHQLGCLLKQKRDYDAIEAERDVTKEANKRLRLELEETKAQSQKERNEKADYQRIKEERTEYHRQLKEKIGNCTALEKEVAELQLKLDVEASFAAQTMAMFSTKPEI